MLEVGTSSDEGDRARFGDVTPEHCDITTDEFLLMCADDASSIIERRELAEPAVDLNGSRPTRYGACERSDEGFYPFLHKLPVSVQAASRCLGDCLSVWVWLWEDWVLELAGIPDDKRAPYTGRQRTAEWIQVPIGNSRGCPVGRVAPDLGMAERAAASVDQLVQKALDDTDTTGSCETTYMPY